MHTPVAPWNLLHVSNISIIWSEVFSLSVIKSVLSTKATDTLCQTFPVNLFTKNTPNLLSSINRIIMHDTLRHMSPDNLFPYPVRESSSYSPL